jgi:hypothetical protein
MGGTLSIAIREKRSFYLTFTIQLCFTNISGMGTAIWHFSEK